jgi:hypothetical protein
MAMRIKLDGLQFCDDCLIVAVNGDYSGIDEHYGRGQSPGRGELRDGAKERAAEIDAGLAKHGPNLVPNFDSESGRGVSEFSTTWCDCCGTKLAGSRHEFAVLEPGLRMTFTIKLVLESDDAEPSELEHLVNGTIGGTGLATQLGADAVALGRHVRLMYAEVTDIENK